MPEGQWKTRPSTADVEAAVHAIADRSRHAARRHGPRQPCAGRTAACAPSRAALLERKSPDPGRQRHDVAAGRANGTSAALLDRLTLTEARIQALAGALENLATLPDPVGEVVRGQTLPNGLRLRQVSVPLGVVGTIYEARPNVTVDIAGLALKSGNAVILRGGSAAAATNAALVARAPRRAGIAGPARDAVQTIDEFGREGANALMHARGLVDVLVPARQPRPDPDRRDASHRAGHRDRCGQRAHLPRRVRRRGVGAWRSC